MKPTDEELRVSADTTGFIAALREIVAAEEPSSDADELHEQTWGANADDALGWGESQGRSLFAEEVRALAAKHGVSL